MENSRGKKHYSAKIDDRYMDDHQECCAILVPMVENWTLQDARSTSTQMAAALATSPVAKVTPSASFVAADESPPEMLSPDCKEHHDGLVLECITADVVILPSGVDSLQFGRTTGYNVALTLPIPQADRLPWLNFTLVDSLFTLSTNLSATMKSVTLDNKPVRFDVTGQFPWTLPGPPNTLAVDNDNQQELEEIHAHAFSVGKTLTNVKVELGGDFGVLLRIEYEVRRGTAQKIIDILLPSFWLPVREIQVNIGRTANLQITSVTSNLTFIELLGERARANQSTLVPEYFLPRLTVTTRHRYEVLGCWTAVLLSVIAAMVANNPNNPGDTFFRSLVTDAQCNPRGNDSLPSRDLSTTSAPTIGKSRLQNARSELGGPRTMPKEVAMAMGPLHVLLAWFWDTACVISKVLAHWILDRT